LAHSPCSGDALLIPSAATLVMMTWLPRWPQRFFPLGSLKATDFFPWSGSPFPPGSSEKSAARPPPFFHELPCRVLASTTPPPFPSPLSLPHSFPFQKRLALWFCPWICSGSFFFLGWGGGGPPAGLRLSFSRPFSEIPLINLVPSEQIGSLLSPSAFPRQQ